MCNTSEDDYDYCDYVSHFDSALTTLKIIPCVFDNYWFDYSDYMGSAEICNTFKKHKNDV
jgi:hypothetical protein